MLKLLVKCITVCLLLLVIAGLATIFKGDVNHVSEAFFMAIYLGILITALIFIRRNRAIQQFIYDRKTELHK